MLPCPGPGSASETQCSHMLDAADIQQFHRFKYRPQSCWWCKFCCPSNFCCKFLLCIQHSIFPAPFSIDSTMKLDRQVALQTFFIWGTELTEWNCSLCSLPRWHSFFRCNSLRFCSCSICVFASSELLISTVIARSCHQMFHPYGHCHLDATCGENLLVSW